MLKEQILELLTVEQWAKFKRFVATKPVPVWVDSDGIGHPDFPTTDVHEFLTTEEKYAEDSIKGQRSDSGTKPVEPIRTGSPT